VSRRGVGAPRVGEEAALDSAEERAESVGDLDELTEEDVKSKKSCCEELAGAERPREEVEPFAFRWNRYCERVKLALETRNVDNESEAYAIEKVRELQSVARSRTLRLLLAFELQRCRCRAVGHACCVTLWTAQETVD
jgi:hypothetical protein